MKFSFFGETEASVGKSMQQHLDRGEWAKAAEQCAKLIKEYQPDNLGLRLRLAGFYLKAGLRESALAQYQETAERYEQKGKTLKGINIYLSMLKIDSGLPLIRVKLAELYLSKGEKEKAWEQGLEAIKSLEAKRLFPQVLTVLEIMANLPFDDYDKALELGEMFQERRQPEKAVGQFLNAAEIGLQSVELNKAAQAYQRVLKIDPQNLEAKNGLQLVQDLKAKEKETAEAKLEALYPQHKLWEDFSEDKLDAILEKLTLPKKKPPTEHLKEHYELGLIYQEMKLLDAAVEEFQLAAQDTTVQLACYQMLKACYEEKGMSGLAREYQQKIIHLEETLGQD